MNETGTVCAHEFHEQQSWIVDGMCPLCVSEQSASYAREIDRLRADNAALREFVQLIADCDMPISDNARAILAKTAKEEK